MTENVKLQGEINELVVLLHDRVINPAQLHRLNQLLASDTEAMDYYLECISVQLGLHSFVSSNFDVSQTSEDAAVLQETIKLDMHDSAIRELIIETEAAEQALQDELMRRRHILPQVVQSSRQPLWIHMVKMAALIMFAMGIILLDRHIRQKANTNTTAPEAIAILSSSVDVQWANDSMSVAEGEIIYPGLLSLTKGYVHLSFNDGAHVVIQAPAIINLKTSKELYIEEGRIAVDIQDGKDFFVVRTPTAVVTDLGTEFGVHVDEDGITESCVFEGKVEVKNRTENTGSGGLEKRMLYAGQAVVVNTTGKIIERDYQSYQYVRVKEYRIKRKAAEDSAYYRWLAYSYELQRQPGLVAYYNFERDLTNQNVLRNSAAMTSGGLDGTLGNGTNEAQKPQWTQGRWPEKGGLSFSSEKHQYVRLPKDDLLAIGGDLSVCWWMKMNEGESWKGRYIVLSYGGAILEQDRTEFDLNYYYSHGVENGCFRAFHEYGDDVDVKVLTQTPVVANQWVQVAVVRDAVARQYLFYLNGELIESHPYDHNYEYRGCDNETSIPTIGCDGGRQREYFNGVLDEVAVFNRVLTSEEIRKHYQAGKVE
ncbi:MAG: FecR domain-containing protein [Sedimentisphaerales bacterium]|nr:FecR domain-containing protein [Sedimentisphaerales bacterium]